MFHFESVEGFDTDNDNLSDHREVVDSNEPGETDPVDEEEPIKRRALKLNGNAAARTRRPFQHERYVEGPNRLRNFTVELWVRPQNAASGADQVLVERPFTLPINNPMGWPDGLRRNFRLGINATGQPYVSYENGGFDPTTVNAVAPAANALVDNVWAHIAATYDGDDARLKLFINGIQVAATPSSLIPYNGHSEGNPEWVDLAPVVIGASDANPEGYVAGTTILVGPFAGYYPGPSSSPNEPDLGDYFKGWVDEIRIWDGARSASEILGSMNARWKRDDIVSVTSGSVTDPELYYLYTFDDLPDPDHSPVAPEGFDLLNGRPNDGTYSHVAWWGTAQDRSLVYDDYFYVPWVENKVAHMPLDPPADSYYTTTIVTNSDGTVTSNTFPNSSNPYNFGYYTDVSPMAENHPEYYTSTHIIFDCRESAVFNDLLPLRYAEADEDVEMWDGGGLGTDDFDTDDDGMPDAWETEYGLDPTEASGEEGPDGDPDGDGLSNLYEYWAGTDPNNVDSNGDGEYDGVEDMDGDGLSNLGEQDAGTLPNEVDTDDDGVTDFEETTGTEDTSYARPPTSMAPDRITDPLDSLDPLVRRCMLFNDDSRVIIPPQDKFMSESWTLEAWINPTSLSGEAVVVSRYVKDELGGGFGINYELGLVPVTGSSVTAMPYIRYKTKSTEVVLTLTNSMVATGADTSIPMNTWTHLAGTYDTESHEIALYVNAELASYRSDATAVPPMTYEIDSSHRADEVTIGSLRSTGTVVNGFVGYIDEVRIWKVARTQEEIEDLYNGIAIVSGGETTSGASYQELSAVEKADVDALLESARLQAIADGGNYSVGYSPVLLRTENELYGLRYDPSVTVDSAHLHTGLFQASIPSSFNWRTRGGVTPVRDQGACGSCWAFGTVGSFESAILINDMVSEDLSEQMLVSCNLDGWGCSGGLIAHKYHYDTAAEDGRIGAVLESRFPYTATDESCGGPYARSYLLDDWRWLGTGPYDLNISDQTIKQAIYTYGPVACAIYAGSAFSAYSGGIFNTDEVSPSGYGNHCVLLVGWNDAEGYWILKNSYGTGWGEDGFMRIAYGTSGVGQGAAYVVYNASIGGQFRFDDGGLTAEDFTVPSDWLTGWESAGILDGAQWATNTFAPLDKDTDGDGMEDWWEAGFGLDPYEGSGDDGAYGDPDGDGLVNIYEYLADTDPLMADTDSDGFNDFNSWDGDVYWTFGEQYSDADGMPDDWEVSNELDPGVYDGDDDPDSDGWSNYAEYMADTDPNVGTNYPTPSVTFHVKYDGLNSAGNLIVFAYNTADMGGTPKAIFSLEDVPSTAVTGEQIGVTGGLTYSGTLDNPNVVPGTLIVYVGGAIAFSDDGGGALSGVDGTSTGTIDYNTGGFTLTYTTAPESGQLITADYEYTSTPSTYPNDFAFASAFSGHLREGNTWFFGFIDRDGDATWSEDEPAGLVERQPVYVGWGDVDDIVLGLSDQDTLPWFQRFSWTDQPGVSKYLVKMYETSGTASLLFKRWIQGNRTFFHENDYRRVGLADTIYGLPDGSSYAWKVFDSDNASATELADGTFPLYPHTVSIPELTWPISESAIIHARAKMEFTADDAATAVRLRIAPVGEGYIYDDILYAPWRSLDGEYSTRFPMIFGEDIWTNGLYRWELRSYVPGPSGGWSDWSDQGRFELKLREPPLGAPSLSGDIVYFGKANGLDDITNLVVQAFTSSGFSGTPHGQVTLTYTCDTNSPTYEKGSFTLLGLYEKPYYVRAFLDIDNDGSLDVWEPRGFAETDSFRPEVYDLSDVDNSLTGIEIILHDRDTDDDGLPDGWEWHYFGTLDYGASYDPEGDGTALREYKNTLYDSDPTKADTDGDGLWDCWHDTNGNGVWDVGEEPGETGDGIHPESSYGTDPTKADTDGDGLSDAEEVLAGYNPHSADSDGDMLTDALEVIAGTDPLCSDTDGDGALDGEEVLANTNPNDPMDVLRVVEGIVVEQPSGPVAALFDIQWQGKDGVTYRVQQSTDMQAWQDMPDSERTGSGTHSVSTGITNGNSFYRVRIVQ